MKVLTILGARPQFIKAAPVSQEIISQNKFNEIILHTGQHYDSKMSQIFFDEMLIPRPKYNLGIGGGTHGSNTGRMLELIEKILIDETPQAVLVYGDTDSTLSGALAAAKLHIPIMHIESGLRSFNRMMPEEINRVLTDHLSDICFAPTINAVKNLKNEGIISSKIFKCDDVMADAARIFGNLSEEKSNILERFNLAKNKYILTTIHRAENTSCKDNLISIFEALNKVSIGKNISIICPLHPRTKKAIEIYGIENLLKNIICIEPIGFLDMISLEKNASLIVTDSGGIQKEAFLHKTPCLTIRNETEWVELIDSKWNCLANTSHKLEILDQIKKQILFDKNSRYVSLYGDGFAADRIVMEIQRFL